jgi:glucokinase
MAETDQHGVAIGVDIGGSKIAAAVVTLAGEVIAPRTVKTPVASGPEAVLGAVCDQIASLLQENPGLPVQAIGVGTAGMVDAAQGVILHANANLPGWTGMPIGARLHALFGLPVFVDNDVNALAVGESRFGAGRGCNEALYVAVGTGIGGAVVRNGLIWRGVHSGAGEVAYLVAEWDTSGRPVIIEDRASGPAMEKRYQALTGSNERVGLRIMTERAYAGEALAVQVIKEGAALLGYVLAPLVAVLDPQILIIGGGVPNVGPLWWQSFEYAFRDSPLPALAQVKLAPAELSTHAGVVGAGALALNEIKP